MKRLILLFFLLFLIFVPKAFAQDNFSTSYDVLYKVNEDETTSVSMNINLRNKTSDYYASSYKIVLSFQDITNIRATDSDGPLNPQVSTDGQGKEILLDFNDRVVGLGKSNQFRITFDTRDIATRYGRIWEVNIPGISNQNDFAAFNVRVETPSFLGDPVFVKPEKNFFKSQNSITFTKDDLGESGVSVSYGDFQVYEFNLNYHLYNKNLFPVVSEIAIPSDNNYQTVLIDDIVPRPADVKKDKDGNWLAVYKLLPSENKDIKVTGEAKIGLYPKTDPLTKEQIAEYTKQQTYWETKDPKIAGLARKLKTPRAIFDYVSNKLAYDEQRVKNEQVRAGASGVLRNPKSAVCLEFTDLFIALSRAAGIPARELEGFANTNNSAQRPLSLLKDILHSWPEYYDFSTKRWIMVDPTWENTTKGIDYFNTFDFDHFAFVIKGISSQYPVPAGGYKTPGHEKVRDVSVSPLASFDKRTPSFGVLTKFGKKSFAGLPIKGAIEIENTGGLSSPVQRIEVISQKLFPQKQYVSVPSLPPFGKYNATLSFSPTSFLTNETDELKIKIGKETIVKSVVVSPIYSDLGIVLGGILIVASITFLSLIIRRSRRIPLP